MTDRVYLPGDPRGDRQRAQWRERKRRQRGGLARPLEVVSRLARKEYRFVKCWKTPGPARDHILQVAGTLAPAGTGLHLCAGTWVIPGYRNVDMHPQSPEIEAGNALEFPGLEEWDIVISDPPFSWPVDYRDRLDQVVTRLLRPGGHFILNAPWLPVASPGLDLRDVFVWSRHDLAGTAHDNNAVLISVSRKVVEGQRVQQDVYRMVKVPGA